MSRKHHKKRKYAAPDISVNPEQQLCPLFDSVSINMTERPARGEMGVRVVDNCAEEHIQ